MLGVIDTSNTSAALTPPVWPADRGRGACFILEYKAEAPVRALNGVINVDVNN